MTQFMRHDYSGIFDILMIFLAVSETEMDLSLGRLEYYGIDAGPKTKSVLQMLFNDGRWTK